MQSEPGICISHVRIQRCTITIKCPFIMTMTAHHTLSFAIQHFPRNITGWQVTVRRYYVLLCGNDWLPPHHASVAAIEWHNYCNIRKVIISHGASIKFTTFYFIILEYTYFLRTIYYLFLLSIQTFVKLEPKQKEPFENNVLHPRGHTIASMRLVSVQR